MARRRSRASARTFSHRWIGGSLSLLGFVLVVGTWLQSPPGRWFLADHGVSTAVQWARERLSSTLVETLRSQGVPADSIRVRAGHDDVPTTLRVSTDGDLLALNVALSGAVENAGGHVLRGWRHEDPKQGPWIELHFGTRRVLTHRVLARRGRVAPPPPPLPRGRLAIVLDDFGNNFNRLTRRAIALPGPVTISVLPELPHSLRALAEAKRAGKPVMLHLPMEPEPGAPVEAGEPQVRVGMDADAVRAVVRRALDDLPGVAGVNNHMGSRATRSRPEMDAVMEVLAEEGLVFLDSQTTPRSVAHLAAGAAGVPHLRNDLFVDRETRDPAVVLQRLDELADKARRRGWAVGIGHVNEATVVALEMFLPRLRPGDVVLVGLPELAHEPVD